MKRFVGKTFITVLGSAILAFGLYNIHETAQITEGGILGATLLLDYWFKISPAISGFVLNMVSYVSAWKLFGKKFLYYSVVAALGFSVFYEIFASFDPLWPGIANNLLLAAILGGTFVGVGAGLCVSIGGAAGGDDALAMSISKLLKVKIDSVYLVSDIIVLILSLSYIPLKNIGYSFITVIISGQIIGFLHRLPKKLKQRKLAKETKVSL